MKISIKKLIIALLSVALLGAVAVPAFAKENEKNNFRLSFYNVQNTIQRGSFRAFGNLIGAFIGASDGPDNLPAISANLFSNDGAIKTARTAYNQAIKQANSAFNTAKNAARDKFTAAIDASNDQASRLAALKAYLTDLLTARKQRSAAKEAALQQFIDALGNVQINQAPTANAQSVTVTENTAKAITLTGSDPEGSALSYAVLSNPSHGTLTGTVPNLTYTPSNNYSGTDSFTFRVNDGSLNSNSATVSITVTSVNQAPTANAQSVTLAENTTKAITLTGSDPEASALTFTVLTNPTHGTLTGTVPNLTYTPNTDYNGTDSFTFKVNDGSLDSTAATVSITVTGVNQAPTANAQSVTVAKNTAKGITLTGSDPEGSALTFTVLTNPTHGTLSGTVPNLSYLPSTDYTGADSFTFKVNDGSLDSTAATVSITVNP